MATAPATPGTVITPATPSRRITWFTLLGLVLVPATIVGLLLGGLWQPTGDLDRVTAAIVNEDQPVTIDGQLVPLGRQMAAGLAEPDALDTVDGTTFDWVLTDAGDAAAGLQDGRYAAVVTIPEGFSQAATSTADSGGTPERATIEVATAEGAALLDPALASLLTRQASRALGEQLTTTYLANVYVGFAQMGTALRRADAGATALDDGTAKLAAGSQELADGATDLSGGIASLASGADQLASGTSRTATGARQLSSGAADLASGTGELADGADQLASGTAQSAAGAQELSTGVTGLASATGQLAGGAASVADGADQLTDGADQLASGATRVAGGTADLAEGLADLAGGASQVADGAEAAGAAAKATSGGVVALVGDLQAVGAAYATCADDPVGCQEALAEALAGLPDAAELHALAVAAGTADAALNGTGQQPGVVAGSAGVATGADRLATAATQVAGAAAKVAGGATDLADGAQGLAEGSAAVAAGADQVAGGTTELADGADRLASGADQLADGAGGLADGAQQAADGADRLADGAGALASGTEALAGGADQLSAGAARAATGTSTLASGAQELAGGATQLSAGSAGLAAGLDQMAQGVPEVGDAQERAAVVARPVTVAGDGPGTLGPQGIALFAALALWVGGIVTYLVLAPVPAGVLTSSRPSWRLVLRATVPGMAVGVVQALVVAALLVGVLGDTGAATAGFVGFSLLVAVAFAAVQQGLAGLFGSVGRYLAMTAALGALVAGIATAVPAWMGTLASLLPLGPAITGLRELAQGDPPAAGQAALLVGWALVGLGLALLAVVRRRSVPAEQLSPAGIQGQDPTDSPALV